MKTVILGAGALGTILAAHLHRAGCEVSVVARESRASALARDGIRITGLSELTATVPVHTDPSAANEADLVINALKTYQSPAVIGALRPKSGAVAFSVQNGVFKNKELAAVFGAQRVLGATTVVSGEVMADGCTRFTANDHLNPIRENPPGDRACNADMLLARFARCSNLPPEQWRSIAFCEPGLHGIPFRTRTWTKFQRQIIEPRACRPMALQQLR